LSRVGTREAAMSLDSVATTHPVVQKVATVDQISQAFDSITYSKGEAVITMMEDYVGEDAWRRGVQDYMRTYSLKNTASDDLWRKIETAAGKPVTAVANDFTLQPGVPADPGGKCHLQRRAHAIGAAAKRVHARPPAKAAAFVARPGDRGDGRQGGGADARIGRRCEPHAAGLRPRSREQRPDRLLQDALFARSARPADAELRFAEAD
jgi:hypothetical protein